jgi:hypothetical protein
MSNKIFKRQVGFYLQRNYNSEVTFGGENTNKFYNQHQFVISGLSSYWQFNGLNKFECGTFVLSTSNEMVRFSTALPYITVPTCKLIDYSVDVGSGILSTLAQRGLACSIDYDSDLIICRKNSISISDFPDVRVVLANKQYTILAADLVEVVYHLLKNKFSWHTIQQCIRFKLIMAP